LAFGELNTMTSRRFTSLAGAWVAVALAGAQAQPPPQPERTQPSIAIQERLTPGKFASIQAAIKPGEDQSRFLDDIPWMTDLWKARQKAAAEGKPLLIFSTTCGPLGIC